MNDLVILYSGGADSRLLVDWATDIGRKPYCILIDYEQTHIKELEYAQVQLDDLGIPYQIVTLHGLDLESGLTGDAEEGRWDNVHTMNVPFRNTMFISIAASIAENLGIGEIWFGANAEDRDNLFPDCYQEYVYAMNQLLSKAGAKPMKLVAPLLGWTKDMIWSHLNNIGVERSELFSGYEEYEEKEEEDVNDAT